MSRALALAPLAVVLSLSRLASAHDETVSSSEVVVTPDALVWRVDVGLLALHRAIGTPESPTEAELKTLAPRMAAYLAKGLVVELDGEPTVATPGSLEPRYEASAGAPALSRVVQELRYQAPRPFRTARVTLRFFSELTKQHRAVVSVLAGQSLRQYVRLGAATLELSPGAPAASGWQTAREFLAWGAEHIFIGFDHIAFLLALLLAATRLMEVVKIVTAFTLAHSVTLLLSALEVITVPSRPTEILIAASIVYVAAQNLLGARTERRWLLTFAFGLVHGLGFASQLRERLAELPGSLVLPVVSFNVGVELGQLVIVAAVFPLLMLARRGPEPLERQRRLLRWGSIPIGLAGLAWVVERVVSA